MLQVEDAKAKYRLVQAEVAGLMKRAKTLEELGWRCGAWQFVAQSVAPSCRSPSHGLTSPR